jgi:hypothetical protein
MWSGLQIIWDGLGKGEESLCCVFCCGVAPEYHAHVIVCVVGSLEYLVTASPGVGCPMNGGRENRV